MFDRRRVLATALGLLLVTTAGCGAGAQGSEDLAGEQVRVAQVVEDLEEAAREGEERRICRQLLSARLARQAGDCTRRVEAALDASDLSAVAVEDVAIRGDRATARIASGSEDEQRETLTLVRENRSWRIDAFGASR
jgi:hypothetical protein